jgi:hypothetical protein
MKLLNSLLIMPVGVSPKPVSWQRLLKRILHLLSEGFLLFSKAKVNCPPW